MHTLVSYCNSLDLDLVYFYEDNDNLPLCFLNAMKAEHKCLNASAF